MVLKRTDNKKPHSPSQRESNYEALQVHALVLVMGIDKRNMNLEWVEFDMGPRHRNSRFHIKRGNQEIV